MRRNDLILLSLCFFWVFLFPRLSWNNGWVSAVLGEGGGVPYVVSVVSAFCVWLGSNRSVRFAVAYVELCQLAMGARGVLIYAEVRFTLRVAHAHGNFSRLPSHALSLSPRLKFFFEWLVNSLCLVLRSAVLACLLL